VICPGCGGKIVKTHVYAGAGGKTSAGVCTKCGKRATMVEYVHALNPPHGTGASSLARKLASGEFVPGPPKEEDAK